MARVNWIYENVELSRASFFVMLDLDDINHNWILKMSLKSEKRVKLAVNLSYMID